MAGKQKKNAAGKESGKTKSQRKPATKKTRSAKSSAKEAREQVVGAVLENSAPLVQAAINAGKKKGSYLQVKYLFELAGIAKHVPDEETGSCRAKTARSLEELLLSDGEVGENRDNKGPAEPTPEA